MRVFTPKLLTVVIATLWAGVLVSAAGAIYSKHRARELFVTLERMNRQREASHAVAATGGNRADLAMTAATTFALNAPRVRHDCAHTISGDSAVSRRFRDRAA